MKLYFEKTACIVILLKSFVVDEVQLLYYYDIYIIIIRNAKSLALCYSLAILTVNLVLLFTVICY